MAFQPISLILNWENKKIVSHENMELWRTGQRNRIQIAFPETKKASGQLFTPKDSVTPSYFV